ncbi:hypothetical protein A2394_02395 [Candidatus Woesebacteria bacterium RIFOXYB1_FULL_42_36]|uniref:Uncharacterized protein n=2 Tax=Candidatus Woeseibacteriota TaxID=1752722 RepID=A0A1F8DGH9_9BACT|nr:MAG: hypothetical protein A2197_03010 [Candidatus Woesebacteria bacterium RIFOXYA1_FULL_48_16]OGM82181.1 MAG: hypothetical protein A2394_02395 [Candidatus Woesebacteria bacterium RIFOXYB1_FULL_42_36]OGM84573.1 MAG: hypothetical protein A2421_00690 [Candidatus Woesebacteria bacterium RIFOXYC1_FULL_43_18]OGM87707.1 MAG: hypothetical protein A2573_00355 [Candidatus Woesebacteria bacterium RIFOXYD1_FULL_43_18]
MAISSPVLVEIGQGLSLMVGLPTIASWNSQKRPQKAKRGTFGFNTQTKSLEYWDGSGWYTAKLS